jgi:hypothetical protein
MNTTFVVFTNGSPGGTVSGTSALIDREDAVTGQATKTNQPSGSAAGRRTRRQLLAGGTGALAVLTAEAIARAAPAYAGTDGDVVLGADNLATTITTINNTTSGDTALGLNAQGIALSASTDSGTAVSCFCNSGTGLVSNCGSGDGVDGNSSSANGVAGTSNTGNGVYGQGGNTASAMRAGLGVSGITDNLSGVGVLGENASAGGVGVSGTAVGEFGVGVVGSGGSIGVQGTASDARGFGVFGEMASAAGVGVLASNTAGGDALLVSGKAAFSRSGVLTVAAGKSSATHTGIALTSDSMVLATLQQDRSGVWLRSAVPDVARKSFTVHLSKAAPARTTVAWFVVN